MQRPEGGTRPGMALSPPRLFLERRTNMVFEDIVKLVMDNGLSIVCVAYLMWYQSNIMSKTIDTLNEITNRLTAIETKLEEHFHDGNV